MGQKVSTTSFHLVGTDEPHATRRKQILAKYPEIKELYGPDIRLLPMILGIITCQLSLCLYANSAFTSGDEHVPNWKWLFLAYSIGGTLTHWLSLGNHELSHNLCFKTTKYNEWLGCLANCAQGIPSAITFKRYHMEHHYYQGDDIRDVDIPSKWEGEVFTNTFMKIIWVFLQPAFYALRPVFVYPKPPTFEEILNIGVVITFDLLWAYNFGISAVLFNITSTLLGMGLHPVAGHFISEHYIFANNTKNGDAPQETYSYYGILNLVAFNVGYHNEHHDFPRIPGFKLPLVKQIASEFYEPLHSYESWSGVIYNYIMRSDIGPYSRVKRADSVVTEKPKAQ